MCIRDRANPNTVYGKSKFLGEEFVKNFANRYFIVRVSRLYSKENNLVESIIEQAKNGMVKVPKSRYGSPTSASVSYTHLLVLAIFVLL